MVVITVENYENAGVQIITVKNEDLFWVTMKDLENGLGLKWIRGMVNNEICGIYGLDSLTKEQ